MLTAIGHLHVASEDVLAARLVVDDRGRSFDMPLTACVLSQRGTRRTITSFGTPARSPIHPNCTSP
jgi:hypothetical protein